MTALYIHIPFCKKKCDYCDFVSYAGKEELIGRYVEAVVEEIKYSPHFNVGCQQNSTEEPQNEFWGIKTLYLGGGTPTLLAPRHFEKILSALRITHYGLREITVEANPKTADREKLKAIRELGANRLSIGIQSFNDKHLRTLGRIHSAAEALRFYDDARSVGFDNINLDLIFAIPGQTLDEWKDDLNIAIGLNPNHLSTYNLTIEEGTPLDKAIKNDKLKMTNEDTAADMFEYTIDTLQAAGFRHYEISNFCRPGLECQHNLNYWKNGDYIGLGAGAHSHLNGQRWANPASIEEYIGCGGAPRNVSRPTSDDSSRATDRRETIFLGLRLTEGLPTAKFQGFEEEVSQLVNEGLLARNNGHYQLTRRGIMLGNQVFSRFV